MTAHLPGAMGIDDNNFIGGLYQQVGKQTHRGTAATHANLGHFLAVNDGRMTYLNFKPAALDDVED